jgi:hypothetical protein
MYGPITEKKNIIQSYQDLVGLDSIDNGHIDFTLGSTEPNMGGPYSLLPTQMIRG